MKLWLVALALGQAFLALDASAPITYAIDAGTAGSGYQAGDRQLAVWALEAWARQAPDALRVEPAGDAEAATIRIAWVAAGAGQYGEMRPSIVNGRRHATVFIHPDVGALGDDIAAAARRDPLLRDAIVYLTCLHEIGHALGLSHTDTYADIMYAFGYGGDIPGYFARYRRQLRTRDDIPRLAGMSTDDAARVRALYPTPAAGR